MLKYNLMRKLSHPMVVYFVSPMLESIDSADALQRANDACLGSVSIRPLEKEVLTGDIEYTILRWGKRVNMRIKQALECTKNADMKRERLGGCDLHDVTCP